MKTIARKNNTRWCISLLVTAALLGGCSLVDPTDIENPNVTEENLQAGASGGSRSFVNGVRRNFSSAMNRYALLHDGTSDNYDNISMNLGEIMDRPWQHSVANGPTSGYNNIHDLRELADFTLDVVIPADDRSTDEHKAETHFYRGMANLMSAEGWLGVPLEEDQPAYTMKQRLDLAVADFSNSNTFGDFDGSGSGTLIHLVLARAYRLLGDINNARTEANAAIGSGNSDYWYGTVFDQTSLSNNPYSYAVLRKGQAINDLQPLPRLDFLDPKYLEYESPIPVAKMEEAYLILAEIALSDGDYDGAKQALADAITLALARPTKEWEDPDPRKRGSPDLAELPQIPGLLVKASPTSPALPDLLIPRNFNDVTVPIISGTSLDADEVLALPHGTTEEKVELLRLVYLARQEIFFFEGRRMTDFGMRRAISLTEFDQNEAINEGDLGTYTYVPSFIPNDPPDVIDKYSFDEANGIVTILYDINQLIADNRAQSFIPPGSTLTTTLHFSFPF